MKSSRPMVSPFLTHRVNSFATVRSWFKIVLYLNCWPWLLTISLKTAQLRGTLHINFLSFPVLCASGAVLRWCRGHVPAPRFTCCPFPRDSKASWPFSWFLRSQNAPKSKFSLRPNPAALPQDPSWWGGAPWPLPRTPSPLSGSNPLQSWQPY